nr:hypothetical protein [Kouleothrix sp.]
MMHDRAGARGDADAAAKTAPAPPALPLARPRRAWLKWLLIGIVVVYVGVLIVVPLGALLAGALAGGLGPA